MIKEVTHPQQLVDDALSAGIERCRSEMPPPYDALANQAFDTARELLSRPEVQELWNDWPDRASRIFVELVIVGTYARVLKNEPPLTLPELTNFIEWIKIIVNSWSHP